MCVLRCHSRLVLILHRRRRWWVGFAVALLVVAREDGLEDVKPSEESAMVEGLLAIIAGAETTAAAATNALYFLIKWPETKKRLQKEIHDALSAYNGDVDYTKFMDLPYLNACM